MCTSTSILADEGPSPCPMFHPPMCIWSVQSEQSTCRCHTIMVCLCVWGPRGMPLAVLGSACVDFAAASDLRLMNMYLVCRRFLSFFY